MKKAYQAPTISYLGFVNDTPLLAGSGEVTGTEIFFDEDAGTDIPALSRRHHTVWDDDEGLEEGSW